MKPKFDIVAEPRGQIYIDLLDFAAARCQSFSLVWRDQFTFEQSAYEVKRALRPFQLSNVRADEWLGTKLIGHEAIVRRYRVSDESVELLRGAGSLYSWLQPKPPEDLALYSADDAGWLVSISHEGRAWFLDESLAAEEIFAYVPGIKVSAHKGWQCLRRPHLTTACTRPPTRRLSSAINRSGRRVMPGVRLLGRFKNSADGMRGAAGSETF